MLGTQLSRNGKCCQLWDSHTRRTRIQESSKNPTTMTATSHFGSNSRQKSHMLLQYSQYPKPASQLCSDSTTASHSPLPLSTSTQYGKCAKKTWKTSCTWFYPILGMSNEPGCRATAHETHSEYPQRKCPSHQKTIKHTPTCKNWTQSKKCRVVTRKACDLRAKVRACLTIAN